MDTPMPARYHLSYVPSYQNEALMETVKVSSKGQIVIPKAIREARHITPGTEFVIRAYPYQFQDDGGWRHVYPVLLQEGHGRLVLLLVISQQESRKDVGVERDHLRLVALSPAPISFPIARLVFPSPRYSCPGRCRIPAASSIEVLRTAGAGVSLSSSPTYKSTIARGRRS